MTAITSIMEEFHFLRPWWLLALLPAVALAIHLHRQQQQSGNWAQVISPVLLPYLLDRPVGKQARLAVWCLLGWSFAVVGLAGPAWQQVPLPIHKQQSALIILLDLSPSMRAEDVTPDRLTRARLKLTDILQSRREGVTALVAYGADAHVVSPLTDDTATIVSQLPALDPDVMPGSGSSPEAAVELGMELAMNAGHVTGDLLLITDGITQYAQEQTEKYLHGIGGFRLSILGVGTEEGAPVPLGDGGFARDRTGAMVLARLDPKQLRNLARRHGGRFAALTGDDSDIRYLLEPVDKSNGEQTRQLQRLFDTWSDQGFWLAILLLPLVILAFRRGLLALVFLAPCLLQPQTAQASFWDDLWWRRDQQGMAALESDPATAAELFQAPEWQGTAAYRNGDYGSAAKAFATGKSARDHYNRGNALAHAGDLDGAIAAYDEALRQQPDMEDAIFNKNLVEQLKQQQQQESKQNQNQNSDGNRQNEGKDENAADQQGQDRGEAGNNPQEEEQSPDHAGEQAEGTQHGKPSDQNQTDGESNPGQDDRDDSRQSQRDNPDSEQGKGESAPGKEDRQPAQQSGDKAAATGDDLTQEQQQAMEQWLRRVPDDPGGLLRNKFKYQAERRAYEQRRRLSPPPDQTQEERW